MSVFIFFFLFFPLLGVGKNDCIPTKCRKDGPIIKFPFRHKKLHPEYCGYPGFDVFCDEKNETVLVLPFSVNFLVKEINYRSQQILLYDPENCVFQKLAHLNLSGSSFHFLHNLHNYTLFNCPASESLCLGGYSYRVYAVDYNFSMDDYNLISCTKIPELISAPTDAFYYNNKFSLKWSKPVCGSCKAQRKRCSIYNYMRVQHIQCIDKLNTNQGASKKLLVAGATLGSFLVLAALVFVYTRIRTDNENQMKIEKFLEDYKALKPSRFSYSDIRRITHQFIEKLGEGGYGIVYKGKLSNEINVAVKVLNSSKGNGDEFVNEVSTIGRIHHVNVVRLVGFCAEGFTRALVYEFLPNDSLEKFIFQDEGSNRKSLGWERLQDIALGIAKGIEYLHEGCDQQILHFDIKPHNILLDQNFNPKICDFGLAKLCSKEQSAVTMTAARGTMGYIAPEVLSRTFGRVSYKSDVYSFGMMLLEMVGGRKNVDDEVNTSQVYFPQWIFNHLNIGEDMWANIEEEGDDGNIARKLSIVGLWCIQWYSTDRPSMKAVVQMLEGDTDNLDVPPSPFPATNGTNSAQRHFQTELPLILELE